MMGYYRIFRGVITLVSTPWNKFRLKINGASYGPHFHSCGSIALAVLSGKLNIGKNVYINSHPIADIIFIPIQWQIRLVDNPKQLSNYLGEISA